MDFSQIEIGTRLGLDLYNEKGEKRRPQLVSKFEGMIDKETIEIYAPIHEGRIFPIHKGTLLDVSFNKNSEVYAFRARTVKMLRKGGLTMVYIRPIGEINKVQRRAYYRFNCIVGAKYRLFSSIDTPPDERGEFINTITKDISGGGICIIMKEAPKMGDFVECKLALNKEIAFIGQIVRVNVQDNPRERKYEVGIQFKKIENKDRECIISYIFERQRSLLKKGWSDI